MWRRALRALKHLRLNQPNHGYPSEHPVAFRRPSRETRA